MNLIEKVASRFGYVSKTAVRSHVGRAKAIAAMNNRLAAEVNAVRTDNLQLVQAIATVRAYAAGAVNRLTENWVTGQSTIDRDIKAALITVRTRARDLMQNNDYAKKYKHLLRTNVLNHQANGFKLQMDCGEISPGGEFVPDPLANRKIEAAWLDWSKAENCSTDGISFRMIQDLVLSYVCRDGEALVRFVVDKKSKYGFRLQVIPIESLDESMNTTMKSGNVVRMGVELDKWHRPVAYHLKVLSPQEDVYSSTITYAADRERIPASEMIHVFEKEFVNQTRGISWLAQSMLRMRVLGEYEYAALINAKSAASKMGFFTSKTDEPANYTGDGEDTAGNKVMDIEPGVFEELPPGMSFTSWDPKYPEAQHGPYVKCELLGMASGLGVSYASLSSDLSDANYSSNRVGMLDEREGWKLVQQWFVESFHLKVFERFLETGLLSGAINLPFKIEKFNRPRFIGRRWSWIDPKNDIEANLLEVQMGTKTLTEIIAEKGEDRSEVFKELADEKEEAKRYGLTLKTEEIKPIPVPGANGSLNGSGNGTVPKNGSVKQ